MPLLPRTNTVPSQAYVPKVSVCKSACVANVNCRSFTPFPTAVEFTSVIPTPLSPKTPVLPFCVLTSFASFDKVSVDPPSTRTPLPWLSWLLIVLNPCVPENCEILNTVITDASCSTNPSPLLNALSCEPASRSNPPFEFTETPLSGLPDALVVPPNETMCAPETTVRPVARLSFTLSTVCESFRNAFAPVATCIPSAFPLMVAFAIENVNELPFTLIPKTRFCDDVKVPVTVTADPVCRSRPCTPLLVVMKSESVALDEVWSEIPNRRLSCTFTAFIFMWAPLSPMIPARPLRTLKFA